MTLAAAVLATLLLLAPPSVVVVLVLAVVWFMTPGAILALRLYRNRRGRIGAAALLGPAWGFALSSMALLALWAAGVRHVAWLALAPALAAGLAWIVSRPLLGGFRPPRFSRRDVAAACLVLLLVPLVVGRPFALVGAEVPEGRAYRAYFTADFVWKMAVVAELSKGGMPPRNQFLHGRPLHYYWTPHLLSAVEYRALNERVRLDALLLVNAVLLGLAFMAFLYAFARQFVGVPAAAAVGCAAAILFSSYEGLERLMFVWRHDLPVVVLRVVNIDAVSRWFYEALPIDGLHRLLLYQPQHHAMAYAVGLSGLLLLVQTARPARPAVMFLIGTLLAATVLLSAFSAIMVTTMAGVFVCARLAAGRHWRAIPACAIAGAIPLAGAAAAALGLQYVDRGAGQGGVIELTVNQMAITRPWLSPVLSFGAVLFSGTLGLWIGMRRHSRTFLALLTVVGVSLFFYYFVNVPDVQDVYVGWRAGHFLFIAGSALTGVAALALWNEGGWRRAVGLPVFGVLALLALPTIVIDLYNTQDIDNRLPGPGFNWTTILTHDELEALEWIRDWTPLDAIVQVEPHVRQNYTWAYIPAFAERRLAAGLPISMVPLRPYQDASVRVREVYESMDAQQAYERAARLRIDYLVVGPPERGAYPELEARLTSHPELFRPVFGNPTMRIFFLEGGPRRPLLHSLKKRG